GEDEGEADARGAAVGQGRVAAEIEAGEIAEAFGREIGAVPLRVAAFEDQHRHAFPAGEEIAVEGAEAELTGAWLRYAGRIVEAEQLQEVAAELHQPVAGAPGMRRARREREAEPLI